MGAFWTMPTDLLAPLSLWELALVPAAGTAVIVALAALAERLRPSPVWQRTIWQASTLGLLALMAVQWSGTGRGVVGLLRSANQISTVSQPSPATAVAGLTDP